MSCLMRLLNFRRRRVPASTTEIPQPPRAQLIPSLSMDVLTQNLDSMLLGIQPEQGFFALTLVGRTGFLSSVQIRNELSQLTGFAAMSRLETDAQSMRVEFPTAGDAALALVSNPAVVVRGQTFTVQYADPIESAQEPARKKLKTEAKPAQVLECKICFDKLEGPYSTPCLSCKHAYCYDCLRNMVSAALGDPERFPARCCDRVLHFDTMNGIVPADNLAKYKLKFEEFSTTQPVYCARPDCSKFLPPRSARPDELGMVCCPQCSTTTCNKCRTMVTTSDGLHKCPTFDPTAYILENFSYKKCPRCNAGIARMFGCPHMRCQCGAHWCWDCQRPIHLCWSRPCDASRENGNETDEDELPSRYDLNEDGTASTVVGNEESNTVDHTTRERPETAIDAAAAPDEVTTIVTSDTTASHDAERPPATTTTTAPEAPSPTVTTTVNENAGWELATVDLDYADSETWERGEWDFGAEPVDETSDIWGCLHQFDALLRSRIPKYWINSATQPEKSKMDDDSLEASHQDQHATCLKCFEVVASGITQDSTLGKEVDCESKTQTEQARPDTAVTLVGVNSDTSTLLDQSSRKGKRTRRANSGGDALLFSCRRCGVVFCLDCKKIENKRLSRALDRTIPMEAV